MLHRNVDEINQVDALTYDDEAVDIELHKWCEPVSFYMVFYFTIFNSPKHFALTPFYSGFAVKISDTTLTVVVDVHTRGG